METTKPGIKSTTIVSGLLGAILMLGVGAGVVVENQVEDITTLVLQLVPILGSLYLHARAIYGRVRAKEKISGFLNKG